MTLDLDHRELVGLAGGLGPFEPALTFLTQSPIASGSKSSVPQAPIPPAWLTAIASSGGQAPAIGAIKIGTRMP